MPRITVEGVLVVDPHRSAVDPSVAVAVLGEVQPIHPDRMWLTAQGEPAARLLTLAKGTRVMARGEYWFLDATPPTRPILAMMAKTIRAAGSPRKAKP